MEKERYKDQFPKIKQPELIQEETEETTLSSHINNGLESVSEGFNYLLHGEKEEASPPKPPKRIHALEIQQHHILLVLMILCFFIIYWALKDYLNPIKNAHINLPTTTETPAVTQPPISTSGSPVTWAVEVPTAVNVADLPPKLIDQMAALYPGISPTTYRWFRTPKGWSTYYDAQKAKVKFSTEGYWLETEERDFPLKDIPEYLQARIRMAYTSYTLIKCERETSSSGKYYELTLKKNRPDNINEEFVVYLSEKAYNYANLYEGAEY